MKPLKILSLIFLSSALLLLSCSKSGQSTTPVTSVSFKWTYNGTTYIASQYTASQYSLGTYYIVGAQGTTLQSFPQCNFHLSSFNKGTYPINSSGVNMMKYVNSAGDQLDASTGEVDITAYGSDKMSGTFSAMLQSSSGSTTPISGTFVNIPVVP